MDSLDKGMIHMSSGKELDVMRFHHTIWNIAQFITDKLSISGILHLIFSDHG